MNPLWYSIYSSSMHMHTKQTPPFENPCHQHASLSYHFLLSLLKVTALSVFCIIVLHLPCLPVAQQSASGHWHFFFFYQEKRKHKEWNKCWKLSFTSTIKTTDPVCSQNGHLLITTCLVKKKRHLQCCSQNGPTVLMKLVLYGAFWHAFPFLQLWSLITNTTTAITTAD